MVVRCRTAPPNDALDLAAIVLDDGRNVRVLADRPGEGGEAVLRRDLHAGARRLFDVAPGPDYNDAHRDHRHFDRGSYRACR